MNFKFMNIYELKVNSVQLVTNVYALILEYKSLEFLILYINFLTALKVFSL